MFGTQESLSDNNIDRSIKTPWILLLEISPSESEAYREIIKIGQRFR